MQHSVTISETLNLTPEAAYRAWTTPEIMAKFMDAATPDFTKVKNKDIKVDLKVGGEYSLLMGNEFPHSGVYKELTPFSKIVFTWNSPVVKDTLITITFAPKGDKTICTLKHELLPEKWVEGHTKGWTNIFKHLTNL